MESIKFELFESSALTQKQVALVSGGTKTTTGPGCRELGAGTSNSRSYDYSSDEFDDQTGDTSFQGQVLYSTDNDPD